MRLVCTLVLFALPLGCSTQGTAVAVSRVEIPTTEIVFDMVRVQTANHRQVRLFNHGTAEVIAYISADGNFAPNNSSVVLPALSSAPASVRFSPEGFADQAGVLHVRIGGVVRDVTLVGTVNPDWDGDGHNDALLAGGDDCDDGRAAVHPGAVEICDGLDNDCNSAVDDQAEDQRSWYQDDDNDSYGTDNTEVRACGRPPGHAAQGGDCDDDRADVHPDAVDFADHADNDCDGFVDDDHLASGQLLISEVMVHPAGATPQYLELRSTHPLWLHLDNLRLRVGEEHVLLPDMMLDPTDPLVLLCGVGSPGTVEGVPCDGALPRELADDLSAQVDMDRIIEEVDWTGWPLTEGASLELTPDAVRAPDNDVGSAWCTSTTQLNDDDRGTPGTIEGHCTEL